MASAENPNSSGSAAENPNPGGSAAETPPPRSRQVVEFDDKYGLFCAYQPTMEFEVNEEFNHMDYCDTDDEEDVNNVPNPREALIQHTKQVRESFGFDLDVVVPSWASVSYYPVDLPDPTDREDMYAAAVVAIDGINADMNGKCYELVEVVKAVLAVNFMHHLTLSAKKLDDNSLVTIQALVLDKHPWGGVDLEQWRFKPDRVDAPADVAKDA